MIKEEDLVNLRGGNPTYYCKYCWCLDYYNEPVAGAILDMADHNECDSTCNYLYGTNNYRCEVGSY